MRKLFSMKLDDLVPCATNRQRGCACARCRIDYILARVSHFLFETPGPCPPLEQVAVAVSEEDDGPVFRLKLWTAMLRELHPAVALALGPQLLVHPPEGSVRVLIMLGSPGRGFYMVHYRVVPDIEA